MNLGAPILDVQVSTTSSTSTTSAKVDSIISGGVVTAPGYDPLVITKTAQNQNGGPNAFVPNIPIMKVNQTLTNTRTVTQNKYADAPSITII